MLPVTGHDGSVQLASKSSAWGLKLPSIHKEYTGDIIHTYAICHFHPFTYNSYYELQRHPTITKVSSGPSAFKGTAEQLLCICLSCNIRRLWRFIEIWAAMAVEDIREPWQFNVPRNCTTSESPVFYCLPKL